MLPDGALDVSSEILKEVDYPIFAFHSFPQDVDLYLRCVTAVLDNRYVNAWAHPGAFLERKGLSVSEEGLVPVFELMRHNQVLLEVNGKYGVPPGRWLELARAAEVDLVTGNDVHYLRDLSRNG